MTYVGGDLSDIFCSHFVWPLYMHVPFSKRNRLTLGPIAPQQHTPLCMHVHSGNGKLTLLSYTSNEMQHKHLCIAVHAWGWQKIENSPYFHTYSRAYMQLTHPYAFMWIQERENLHYFHT